MVVVLVLLPVALLIAAAVAALVSVRRSTVRITPHGVEIHNYPQALRTVPLAEALRFEPTIATGNLASTRPKTAVLVLVDGTRLPVRSLTEPDAGYGVEALNARLEKVRAE